MKSKINGLFEEYTYLQILTITIFNYYINLLIPSLITKTEKIKLIKS